MGIEVSRRWFVFGSAAAIAAATVPVWIPPAIVTPVSAQSVFLLRKVFELSMWNNGSAAGFLDVFVHNDEVPWHRSGVPPGGMYFWRAMRGNEIDLLPDSTFRMAATAGIEKIFVGCLDTIDEGPPIYRYEEHTFKPDGSVVVIAGDLDPDNSLEARLARQAAADRASELEDESGYSEMFT